MIEGIKTLPDGDHCVVCNLKVNADYAFCPNCGNPLNNDSMLLKQEQNKSLIINFCNELANELSDQKSIKIIINKLKNL